MSGVRAIRSICQVCSYQLSLQFHELRTKVAFLMVFLYLSATMSPIKDFAVNIGQGISFWLFPVLMNDLVCTFVIFCLWCFLVCNAPFRNDGYLYYAGRAGKRNWICGEVLFLFIYSGIYFLVINLFLLILTLPNFEPTLEWGKTIGTLAYTDATFQFRIPIEFPSSMMSSITPVTAMVLSFLLNWCVAFLLALCIFSVNWSFKTSLGVAFALLWVFMDLTVYNLLDGKWRRYSPVSLAKLSMLMGRYRYLTPAWALLFLSGIIVLLLMVIFICAKIRKGIE